jgi:predicted dithiol-disulfide oxidoreductase (DUF899 family)
VDEQYRFENDKGNASLADLFKGRSQLLVYHFMFGSDYTAGCPSCSVIADCFNGIAFHLANHNVMLWAVFAGASRETAELQEAVGLDVSLSVLLRKRHQVRLQRRVRRGAAARRHRKQLPSRAARTG